MRPMTSQDYLGKKDVFEGSSVATHHVHISQVESQLKDSQEVVNDLDYAHKNLRPAAYQLALNSLDAIKKSPSGKRKEKRNEKNMLQSISLRSSVKS